MNSQSRKKAALKSGKALWHFYLPFPHADLSSVAVLMMSVHVLSVGERSLVLEGAEQTLSTNYLICQFCPGMPEGLIQDTCLTLNLLGQENGRCYLKILHT